MAPLRQGNGGHPVLVAERLTRTFESRTAVREVTLSVHAGEIVALLGPNGAGKTTTMRMMAGLIAPTSGRVSINGDRVDDRGGDARGSVGLLTEAPGLWERLSVRTNLVTYARLQGVADVNRAVDESLSHVDLTDRANDTAGKLSKGLKQRVAIARALLHRPPVLLLDEPTSGLDPASARHVRDLIRGLRSEGRAILVSTHNLGEAEELADRIAVLKTTLLALDAPAMLRQTSGGRKVVVETEGAPAREIALTDFSEIPDIVAGLVGQGARIMKVTPAQRSLEEVYLSLVGSDS